MSAAAFALREGRRVEISPMRCLRWVAVFTGEELEPLAYETIPHRVLPPGVDVAYFNVNYFNMAMPPGFFETVAGSVPEAQGVEPPVRDEPFFALNRAGHFVPITNRQAVLWMTELYPSNPPTEARFDSIPYHLLPPHVRVAWFDAYTFHMNMPGWAQRDVAPGWSQRDLAPLDVAQDLPPARRRRVAAKAVAKAVAKARPMPPSTDTRPLMTPQWRLDNADEFGRLYLAYPTTCPICVRAPVHCFGPIHGTIGPQCIPTRCTHMMCCPCWIAVSERDRKCPFCRDDVSEWLSLKFPSMLEGLRVSHPDLV
jgi:hypothetical protein